MGQDGAEEKIVARPILLEIPDSGPNEDLIRHLAEAPSRHAEAVLAGFEVLQGLHDRGELELFRGMLGGSDKILESVVGAMHSPDTTRGTCNLIVLSKAFGSVDPELLKRFAQALPDTLASAARAQKSTAPGLRDAFRMLRSTDFRRGLAMLGAFLAALQNSFASGRSL
jgi:uncharacterized protein YjgD (DUF1641 family)